MIDRRPTTTDERNKNFIRFRFKWQRWWLAKTFDSATELNLCSVRASLVRLASSWTFLESHIFPFRLWRRAPIECRFLCVSTSIICVYSFLCTHAPCHVRYAVRQLFMHFYWTTIKMVTDCCRRPSAVCISSICPYMKITRSYFVNTNGFAYCRLPLPPYLVATAHLPVAHSPSLPFQPTLTEAGLLRECLSFATYVRRCVASYLSTEFTACIFHIASMQMDATEHSAYRMFTVVRLPSSSFSLTVLRLLLLRVTNRMMRA